VPVAQPWERIKGATGRRARTQAPLRIATRCAVQKCPSTYMKGVGDLISDGSCG
jgi:hypothetical protein